MNLKIEISELVTRPVKDLSRSEAIIGIDGIPIARFIRMLARDINRKLTGVVYMVQGITPLEGIVWNDEGVARSEIEAYLSDGVLPPGGDNDKHDENFLRWWLEDQVQHFPAPGDGFQEGRRGTCDEGAGQEGSDSEQAGDEGREADGHEGSGTDLEWELEELDTSDCGPMFRIERKQTTQKQRLQDGSMGYMADVVAEIFLIDSEEETRRIAERFMASERLLNAADDLVKELTAALPPNIVGDGDWLDTLPFGIQDLAHELIHAVRESKGNRLD